ncbi:hypothetical protein [Sandarakinorhabdus rubra]|uniref:hypothetical protein n=1 Tax=Sandarakinorhabdus rubra TaxID=2672568 RepID=UPI0013D9E656|nr:hypothetical protein [Sandarakinorhabdus rubra]
MGEIDKPRLAQLLALMGREQLLALAAQLADGLAELTEMPTAHIGDHLHRLRGGAASLGLAGLAADLAAAEAGQGNVAALAQRAPGLVQAYAAALHAASCQR